MLIPNLSSLRITGLAAGTYRLLYRPIDDVAKAGESKVFSVPGPGGQEATIKLPMDLIWNNQRDMFMRVKVDQF